MTSATREVLEIVAFAAAIAAISLYSSAMLERLYKWWALARDSRALRPIVGDRWSFKCVTPGETRKQIGDYWGKYEDAVQAIEAGGVFKVTDFNAVTHEISYAVDWVGYRELMPCKWHAIHMGLGGGDWMTAPLKRSEALNLILQNGARKLRRIDDEHALIFYAEKDAAN